MRVALGLARRGLGNTAPNPSVGCVLVRPDLDNRIVGRGWTQPGGRPHAETEAIGRAGDLAAGSSAYVTLEPCCHHGQTPPCTEALVKAGVRHVYVAVRDPDTRVAGQGIEALKKAGAAVLTGILEQEARALNAGFFSRIEHNRPYVTIKTATSLDGRIAPASGHGQWITGPLARSYGHLLRARHDAVVTGMGTVRADDPNLTCRLPGLLPRSPVRVVLDSRLEIPQGCKMVSTATDHETWVITANTAPGVGNWPGVTVLNGALDASGMLTIGSVLGLLAERGINTAMVEAGSKLNAAFLKSGHVDEIRWFRAPLTIGGDGLSAFDGVCVEHMPDAHGFTKAGCMDLGPDRLETYLAKDAVTQS